jgi:kinesin family protein 5
LEAIAGGASLTAEEAKILQTELINVRTELDKKNQILDSIHKQLEGLRAENTMLESQKKQIEDRFASLEVEYEELLDKTIAEEEKGSSHISENIKEWKVYCFCLPHHSRGLKMILSNLWSNNMQLKKQSILSASKRCKMIYRPEIRILKNLSCKKLNLLLRFYFLMALSRSIVISVTKNVTTKSSRLVIGSNRSLSDRPFLQMALEKAEKTIEALQAASSPDNDKDLEKLKQTMAQQLSDFDVMKKALMRDIQSRCEKVFGKQYGPLLKEWALIVILGG